jgi:hypothetical protein
MSPKIFLVQKFPYVKPFFWFNLSNGVKYCKNFIFFLVHCTGGISLLFLRQELHYLGNEWLYSLTGNS